jgi:hypothetical protein
MSRQEMLDTLLLLSALESWSFSTGQRLPDYLHEQLSRTVELLSKKLLEVEKC